jgi:carbon starvation protein CstA
MALSFGTVFILEHSKKWQYALITFLPSLFMFATTFSASWYNIFNNYLPQHSTQGNLNAALSITMLILVVIIFIESARKCISLLQKFQSEKTYLLSKA